MHKLSSMHKAAFFARVLGSFVPSALKNTPWASRALKSGLTSGVMGGALGGGVGALTAEEGQRWKGFGTGFAQGFVPGVGLGVGGSLVGSAISRIKVPNMSTGQRAFRMNAARMADNAVQGAGFGAIMSYGEGGDSSHMLKSMAGGALAGMGAHGIGMLNRTKTLQKGTGLLPRIGRAATGGVGQMAGGIGLQMALTPKAPEQIPQYPQRY